MPSNFGEFTIFATIAAAILAGFSRGFAAFGTALVYIPIVSSVFDIRTAVVTLFLVDLLPSAPLVYRAAKRTDFNVVVSMGAAAVMFSPVGVLALRFTPEKILSALVALFLIAVTTFNLLAGVIKFRRNALNSFVAGGMAGLVGGAIGLYGPPAMIYLLGAYEDAMIARTTAFVFLSVESIMLGFYYYLYGLYAYSDFKLVAIMILPYAAALWIGVRVSGSVSAILYRKIILIFLLAFSIVLFVKTVISF